MAVSKVREEHIAKVKIYSERVQLRRLMALQKELEEKRKWLEGYDNEPNPYLREAAIQMREAVKKIDRETDLEFRKLSTETQAMVNGSR